MVAVRIPQEAIDEADALVAVSAKTEKRLEVEHGVVHPAQDVRNAGYVDVEELKSLYRRLDCGLEAKTGEQCCVDHSDNMIPGGVGQYQELCAEKEWLRNVIIDMLLMEDANTGKCSKTQEILQLKETSRMGRTKSTALRLRFNSVKGCKNYMQEARRLLMSVIEHTKSKKVSRAAAFVAACLLREPAGERRLPKACFPALDRATELIFRSYFSLPPRARIPSEAQVICSIDLLWLDQARLGKDWLKKTRSWKGSFKPSREKKKYVTLAQVESALNQVEEALQAFEAIKKRLKEAFSHHSAYALQAEERILEIRNEAFDESVNGKKKNHLQ